MSTARVIKGFAPLVRFPGKNETLLMTGASNKRSGVMRSMWFFNSRRSRDMLVEVRDVLPVVLVERSWPEPVREALSYQTLYWFADITSDETVWGTCWDGDDNDCRRLERGLVHLTLEAAQAHADALLAMSK